jgi:hypothetical protein
MEHARNAGANRPGYGSVYEALAGIEPAMKWAVVVPTNRPDRFVNFMRQWAYIFAKHEVVLIVVADMDTHDPDILHAANRVGECLVVNRTDFSEVSLAVPFGTDMIRSGGFKMAKDIGADYILSLDDDVYPQNGVDIFTRYERVFDAGAVVSPYLSVGALTNSPYQMRGFPYSDREPQKVMVQYGGWHDVLDFDALTQLWGQGTHAMGDLFESVVMPVPLGTPVTTCAMNFAFRAEATLAMWQFPLLDGRFNRMGDMWSGLIQKRVCDALGQAMVINGKASVFHTRASDPHLNYAKEVTSMGFSDEVWNWTEIKGSPLSIGSAWTSAISSLALKLLLNDAGYSMHLVKAADQWYQWVMG